jgi:hypothetical protein
MNVKSATPTPLAFRLFGTNEELDEILDWLKIHVPQSYHEGHRFVSGGDGLIQYLDFKNKESALLFKLTWVV